MQKTKWFDRVFPPQTDNGLLPGILERLDGTPARLRHLLADWPADANPAPPDGGWTLRQQIGHLIDLEPLWFTRLQQIAAGETQLAAADLTNARTHQGNHNEQATTDLIERFAAERAQTVAFLRHVPDAALDHAAVHPRLGTPMRLIDLAYFVAEHDDHHLADVREVRGEK